MSAAELPNELLTEILRHRLSVAHADFLRFPHSPAPPRWGARYSGDAPDHDEAGPPSGARGLLRVCRRWAHVGTPLLYECVRAWAPAHVAALARLLAAHPDVARRVRCLRLEGALGRGLPALVARTPNVYAVYVDLHVRAAESVAGLRKSVALLNPATLCVYGGGWRKNRRFYEALGVVREAIQDEWKNLSSIAIGGYFEAPPDLGEALRDAPALRTLALQISPRDFQKNWLDTGAFFAAGENAQLTEIQYRGLRERTEVEALLRDPELPDELRGRVSFVATTFDRQVERALARMVFDAEEDGEEDGDQAEAEHEEEEHNDLPP